VIGRWIGVGAVAVVAADCGGDDTIDVSAATEWTGDACTTQLVVAAAIVRGSLRPRAA
jgi:hypothetical protein